MPAAAKMKSKGKVMVIQRLSGCVLFCRSFITGYCEARSQLRFRFYSLFRFRATSRTSFIHPALLTLDILGSSKVWPLILDGSMIYAKKEGWWCVTITSTVAVFFTSYGARVKLLAFIFGMSIIYCRMRHCIMLLFRNVSDDSLSLWAHLGSRVQIWGSKCAKSGQRVAKEWPKSGLWGVEARSHEPKPGQLKRDDDAYDASHLSPTPWKGIDLYPLHIASGAIQLATEQLPIWVLIWLSTKLTIYRTVSWFNSEAALRETPWVLPVQCRTLMT